MIDKEDWLTREEIATFRAEAYGRCFGAGNTAYISQIGHAEMRLCDTTLAALDALDAELKRVRVLRAALRAVEWEQNGDGSPWRDSPRWWYCPSCGNVKNTLEEIGVHAAGCALAAALAATDEGGA